MNSSDGLFFEYPVPVVAFLISVLGLFGVQQNKK